MSAVVKLFNQCAGECPLLPEGEYRVIYTGHDLKFMFNTGKLFVKFRVYDGEFQGSRLYRAYNVKMTGKKSFKLAHSSALYRQFCTLSGRRERPDRIAVSRLKHCVIRVSVRTVKQDAKQRPLAENLQYSVINEWIALEVGTLA
jgi:hypothetical protein